jgi:signal transduction histidine kinase
MMLRLPRRTARLRLTALYGGLFLLSGVALVGSTYVLYQRATASKPPQLPRVPHTPSIQSLPKPELPQALFQLSQAQHALAQDQNQLKTLPLGSAGPRPQISPVSPVLARDEHQLVRDQQKLGQAAHQLAQAVHQAAQAGAIQAAQRAADSHQLLIDSGIALGVVAVLAVLAGWLVAGRMLRPIRTITGTARRISSTSLHERLALNGPDDELKELGDTLDDLFARLEASFEAQRRFVAHASHELRTPLTRERTLLQVALDDPATPEVWRSTGQQLLASNREQETLIEALLTLATSESGVDHLERVDLAEIVDRVLRDRPDTNGLHLETSRAAAPLDGDPRLLERLVANLVDNAIRHNLDDGQVRVMTATKDNKAVLAVTNTGPVIPPTELDRLSQPFQRLDPGRLHHSNGHGLGLSIVRAIANAHAATINAQSLANGGLTVEVAFPVPRDRRQHVRRAPNDLQPPVVERTLATPI